MGTTAGRLGIGLTSIACVAVIAVVGVVRARPAAPQAEQALRVGPLTVVVDAGVAASPPLLSEPAAATSATTVMQQKANPLPHGYRLTAWGYHAGLTKVVDGSHRVLYGAEPPEDDYVLYFVAPPQLGFRHLSAVVAVDARNGRVHYFGQAFVP